jgi:hypothetical protein
VNAVSVDRTSENALPNAEGGSSAGYTAEQRKAWRELRECARRHLTTIREHAAELLPKLTPEQIDKFHAEQPRSEQRRMACRFARDGAPTYINGKEIPSPRELPTSEQLNQAARKFWEPVSKLADRLIAAEPHTLRKPDGLRDLLMSAGRAHKLIQQDQAKRAQKKRRKDPLRTAAVEAMRRARAEDQAFDDFLTAAITGSVDGLTFERRGEEFVIDADVAPDEKRVTLKTLRDWWAEAGKKIIPG